MELLLGKELCDHSKFPYFLIRRFTNNRCLFVFFVKYNDFFEPYHN